jgi:prevent-host-death family protein
MKTVTIQSAKNQLSSLIEQVCQGEEIWIAKDDKPVARLIPFKQKITRVFGALKGQIKVDEGFFEPLPQEELSLWEAHDRSS